VTDPPLAATGLDSGFDGHLGTEIVAASPQEVRLRLVLGPQHRQPYGVVHGGVWAALAETAASIGAALNSRRPVVGLENHTSFLRAIRDGAVLITARPVHPGRTSQVWEVTVAEEADAEGGGRRPVSRSVVRLHVLPPGATVAGRPPLDGDMA
jgi:1,4-dihydroxy-2-naphthoyl-CoA hydrolase